MSRFSVSSDEQALRNLASEIEQLCSFLSPEPPLEGLSQSKKLVGYVLEPLEAAKDEKTWKLLKKELLPKIVSARTLFNRIKTDISIVDLVIMDSALATAEVIVTAAGQEKGDNGPFLDRHLVRVQLIKVNGAWLIKEGKYIENLRDD